MSDEIEHLKQRIQDLENKVQDIQDFLAGEGIPEIYTVRIGTATRTRINLHADKYPAGTEVLIFRRKQGNTG